MLARTSPLVQHINIYIYTHVESKSESITCNGLQKILLLQCHCRCTWHLLRRTLQLKTQTHKHMHLLGAVSREKRIFKKDVRPKWLNISIKARTDTSITCIAYKALSWKARLRSSQWGLCSTILFI